MNFLFLENDDQLFQERLHVGVIIQRFVVLHGIVPESLQKWKIK
jgi:hypothetical protein